MILHTCNFTVLYSTLILLNLSVIGHVCSKHTLDKNSSHKQSCHMTMRVTKGELARSRGIWRESLELVTLRAIYYELR